MTDCRISRLHIQTQIFPRYVHQQQTTLYTCRQAIAQLLWAVHRQARFPFKRNRLRCVL